MKTLDCRQQQCPTPVVETRQHLLAEPGVPVTILVGDGIARQNITRLATNLGYQVTVEPTDGGFALVLTQANNSPKAPAATAPAAGKTVVYIASDCMGSGNDELGRLLMRNFLFTLNELDTPPDAVLFVNTGVKLTTEGSAVMEALKKLVCNDADLASCGLCLDFFGLKEKLQVGRTTNMLDIIEQMAQATRVIQP